MFTACFAAPKCPKINNAALSSSSSTVTCFIWVCCVFPASSLIQKVFPLIWKWEWRTTENFLYNYSSKLLSSVHLSHLQSSDLLDIKQLLYWDLRCCEGAVVPPCVSHKEHLQLIDAGLMLNLPYPPFLGGKRDADLLIALDYGSDEAFKVSWTGVCCRCKINNIDRR